MIIFFALYSSCGFFLGLWHKCWKSCSGQDEETFSPKQMVLVTYVASLNQCHVAVLDAEGEPAAVMEGLGSEGILGSYEEISLTDYATAMNQINQAIQGE